jgi:hypothetical protein
MSAQAVGRAQVGRRVFERRRLVKEYGKIRRNQWGLDAVCDDRRYPGPTMVMADKRWFAPVRSDDTQASTACDEVPKENGKPGRGTIGFALPADALVPGRYHG